MLKTSHHKDSCLSLFLLCLPAFLFLIFLFCGAPPPPLCAQESGGEGAPASGFSLASFTINGGSPVTDIHEVNLNLAVEGDPASLQVRYADEGADWCDWEPYSPERPWLLPAGDGPRTVAVQISDTTGSTITAAASIYIHLPVTRITLDRDELRLKVGGAPAVLQARVQPADATAARIYWSSGNEKVAVVEDGTVIPTGAGETTIATAAGNCRTLCRVIVEPGFSISGRVAPAEGPVTYGDVNGDGQINVVDAVMVLRTAAGLLELDGSLAEAADVYRDGRIDTKDAVLVLRFVTGQVSELPVEPEDEPVVPDPLAAPALPSDPTPTDKLKNAVYRISAVGTVLDNGLRVRSGPATSYAVLGQLEKGARVTVYAKVQGGDPSYPDWYRITYNNQEGYIAAHYVSLESTLYGLDFANNRTYICAAPAGLQPGDYKIDQDYNFYRLEGAGQVSTGIRFNFLEQNPYAILYLERPAGAAISADYLNRRVAQIRPDSPLKTLGGAFILAQDTWGVNALYLAAHAALESAWGTSSIAQNKNNIYGFMAYDHDPYGSAAAFRSMADCTMHVSGYIRREYHSRGGKYYNGANLVGMNVKYATDPMWAFKIANTMQSILSYSAYEHAEKYLTRGRTTENLHLRAAPGADATSITVIPKDSVTALRGLSLAGDCGWYYALYDGREGWSCGDYIVLIDWPRAAVYLSDWYKAGSDNLKLGVFGAPGVLDPVDELPFGTVFRILETTTACDGSGKRYCWHRIAYPGSAEQSWVRGDSVIIDW